MKRDRIGLVFLLGLLLALTASGTASELIDIETYDGYNLTGKLDLPDNADRVKGLVIYVPGTGPCTYENHRKIGELEFNYFDLFAEELTCKGVGFFRYNTRGTTIGENPPYYDSVDREIAGTNTPGNHARDVESIIRKLREQEELKDVPVILLGWSEGTVIAPLVAERDNVRVDALFLAGYENETIPETMEWQLSGGSSMVFYRQYFDSDRDGLISEDEFLNGPEQIKKQTLQGAEFGQLDVTRDGYLSQDDFKIMLQGRYQQVMEAFENKDDDWIWQNYFRISSDWYEEHARLEPNKERLLKLDLPIYIFHGAGDQNVPVEGVYDIKSRFALAGKDNLRTFIFADHDHDLNYMLWPLRGIISEGFSQLFVTIAEFASHE